MTVILLGLASRKLASLVIERQGLHASRVVASWLADLPPTDRRLALDRVRSLAPDPNSWEGWIAASCEDRPGVRLEGSALRGLQLVSCVEIPNAAEVLMVVAYGRPLQTSVLSFFAVAATAAASLSFWVGRGIATRVLEPVVDKVTWLRGGIARLDAGALHHRFLPGDSNDEFDQIAGSIDRMAASIDSLQESERGQVRERLRWSARLGHDINTPVSVIRGHVEELLDREDVGPSELRRSLGEVLGQARYVELIVEDLVAASLLDIHELRLHIETVALDDVLAEIVDGFELFARRRGIELRADGGRLALAVDRLRLRQVLTNLVCNAVTHARQATVVEISARREGDEATLLQVVDDGATSEDFSRPGWGLGGGIVDALVALHAGTVQRDRGEFGFVVSIRLPDQGRVP